MLSDIEIAHAARLRPIEELAREIGLRDDEFDPYGRDKAKVRLDPARPVKGKLILVTATSGMPAGSGKTTTSIALAQAMRRLGMNPCLALREPSLGPCFGMKGGAAGGGYSQVLPMESINLHFTGDFHAITAANNLLAAIIDNCRFRGEHDIKEITWKRVLDVNDRNLRFIVAGLGGPVNGVPTETGFDITAASELMAVLCLAKDEADLRARIERLVVAVKNDGTPLTCGEIGCAGALMALLLEATKPNLVQTIEGGPAFIHGGPFANIAHGCNSVAATRAALTIGDYAITEAGFGSELGAEKFYDIKCRSAGLTPSATVLVTSARALHWHGGVPLPEIGKPDLEALEKGICNLEHHIRNIQAFGQKVVVALNHFGNEEEAEIETIKRASLALGARFAVSDGFARGGAGAEDLAREVAAACEGDPAPLNFAYEEDVPVTEKIQAVITRCYGAAGYRLSSKAAKDLKTLQAMGFDRLPVCIAKTPLSLTHDARQLGAPKGFTIPVERLILNAGAGFVVVTTGSILRMPGLPKVPNAFNIDVKDGEITGLS